jgi:tRNA(fMet)-specific endonuclease VapC
LRYLADTDWVINYQRGIVPVVHLINSLLPDGIGLSVISLAELYDGILGSPDPSSSERALRDFLAAGVSIVDIDEAVCWRFASERRRLRTAGTPIADFDLLIGTTALQHNLTLLTNNRRNFERLSGLRIISA